MARAVSMIEIPEMDWQPFASFPARDGRQRAAWYFFSVPLAEPENPV
jgi:hypothetical protein